VWAICPYGLDPSGGFEWAWETHCALGTEAWEVRELLVESCAGCHTAHHYPCKDYGKGPQKCSPVACLLHCRMHHAGCGRRCRFLNFVYCMIGGEHHLCTRMRPRDGNARYEGCMALGAVERKPGCGCHGIWDLVHISHDSYRDHELAIFACLREVQHHLTIRVRDLALGKVEQL
jgi:hypothetical protein